MTQDEIKLLHPDTADNLMLVDGMLLHTPTSIIDPPMHKRIYCLNIPATTDSISEARGLGEEFNLLPKNAVMVIMGTSFFQQDAIGVPVWVDSNLDNYYGFWERVPITIDQMLPGISLSSWNFIVTSSKYVLLNAFWCSVLRDVDGMWSAEMPRAKETAAKLLRELYDHKHPGQVQYRDN